MRNENRNQESGGKQWEINLTFGNRPFLTRLVSCGRYGSNTTCHTLVLRTEPKPPYMCPGGSNHMYDQQYGEHIQYLIKLQARIFTKWPVGPEERL
jgi:hypothetical protein